MDRAADHRVSDANYLPNPEGNAIEIYADHPEQDWTRRDGEVQRGTEPLDLDGIMGSPGLLPPILAGTPEGTCASHVYPEGGDGRLPGAGGRTSWGLTLSAPGHRRFSCSTGATTTPSRSRAGKPRCRAPTRAPDGLRLRRAGAERSQHAARPRGRPGHHHPHPLKPHAPPGARAAQSVSDRIRPQAGSATASGTAAPVMYQAANAKDRKRKNKS